MQSISIGVVCILWGSIISVLGDSVPLFIWTNIKNNKCDSNIFLSPEDSSLKLLESDYINCLVERKPKEIKLFVTDELSESDFSISSHFSKLQNFKDNLQRATSSLVMPSIHAEQLTSDIVTAMKEKAKNSSFSIVSLPPINRKDSEIHLKSLQNMDKEMQNILDATEGEYVAIFTADSSPHKRSLYQSSLGGRHLLQAATTAPPTPTVKPTFVNTECLLMYFTGVNLTVDGKSDILTYQSDKLKPTCAYPEASVDLYFTSTQFNEVVLSMKFVVKFFTTSARNWWYLAESSLTVKSNTTAMQWPLNDSYTAPSNWSWVCNTPPPLKYPKGSAAATRQFQFLSLQVQAFNMTNATFSSHVDCSGLLTPGIWMGLLVTLLIILIFSFGMSLLMGVTTMDRFDDVKGKMLITHSEK